MLKQENDRWPWDVRKAGLVNFKKRLEWRLWPESWEAVG